MDKARLKEKFEELLNDYQPLNEADRLYQKAINCGLLDIENESDDFRLPKIIWYAILKKMTADCTPLHPDNRKLANDLATFL